MEENKINKLYIVIPIILVLIASLFIVIYLITNKEKKEVKKEIDPNKTIEIKSSKPIENVIETTYDGVITNTTLIDKVDNYSIYTSDIASYIVNDELKTIIETSKEKYLFNIEKIENECSLLNISKCDYYTLKNIETNKIYFMNKKDNVMSINSYNGIGCSNDDDNLYLCEDNTDSVIVYINEDKTKYGLLNIETGLNYIEPKYDEIEELGNNKFVVKINDKVGLYTKDNNEVLPINYDFIGVFKTNNDKTYITIKNNEIKFYDENMKSKKLKVNEETSIKGLMGTNSFFIGKVIKANIQSNNYFDYKGKDYKGEKYFIVLRVACGDYIDNEEKYIDTKDSVIYVIEKNKLIKLNPELVVQNQSICGID